MPNNLVGFGLGAKSARQHVWDEIQRHRTAITDLTTRLNMLAYTACFPTELLSEIFLKYADLCFDEIHKDEPSSILRPYTYIRVSHVCRHWREVALSTRSLWSNILVTSSLSCVKTMLERSYPSQISVQASVADMEYPNSCLKFKALEAALRELSRTQSLDLRLPRPWFVEVRDILESPAPMLEYLTMYNRTQNDSKLPIKFDTSLNRLRSLDINGTVVPVQRLSCPTLQQFVIKLPSTPCDRIPAEHIASSLATTPLLENLVLKNALAAALPEMTPMRVSLPSLQVLRIADLAPGVRWLLDILEISPYSIMSLDCTRQKGDTDWSALGASISAKRAEVDQTYPILTYSVRLFTVSASLLLEGWESEIAPIKTIEDVDDDEGEPPLSIALPASITQVAFSAIFRALPLANTVTLYLDAAASPLGLLHLLIGEWFLVSGTLPKLRNLYLDGWAESAVALLLGPNTISEGSQGDLDGIIFPGLQKVVLRAVVFDGSASKDEVVNGEEGNHADGERLLATLSDGLSGRQANFVPLQELVLEYCIRLRPHHVKLFKDALRGTRIEWDGKEQMYRAEWL